MIGLLPIVFNGKHSYYQLLECIFDSWEIVYATLRFFLRRHKDSCYNVKPSSVAFWRALDSSPNV